MDKVCNSSYFDGIIFSLLFVSSMMSGIIAAIYREKIGGLYNQEKCKSIGEECQERTRFFLLKDASTREDNKLNISDPYRIMIGVLLTITVLSLLILVVMLKQIKMASITTLVCSIWLSILARIYYSRLSDDTLFNKVSNLDECANENEEQIKDCLNDLKTLTEASYVVVDKCSQEEDENCYIATNKGGETLDRYFTLPETSNTNYTLWASHGTLTLGMILFMLKFLMNRKK